MNNANFILGALGIDGKRKYYQYTCISLLWISRKWEEGLVSSSKKGKLITPQYF
jgi:hypothetical protein